MPFTVVCCWHVADAGHKRAGPGLCARMRVLGLLCVEEAFATFCFNGSGQDDMDVRSRRDKSHSVDDSKNEARLNPKLLPLNPKPEALD